MNAQEYLNAVHAKQKARYAPSSITFELTPFCNFNCNMCYIHIDKQVQARYDECLNTMQWVSLIEGAAKAGVLSIGFTGGEVFTRPDFREIYETAYNLGFMINILSNGYLVSDDVVKWLSIKKPDRIRFTIYGASNDTYKRICGIEDGYSIVTSNIAKLKRANINIAACMTVTKDNQADLRAVLDFCRNNDLQFSWSDNLRMPVRGAKREITSLRVNKQIPDDISEIEHEKDLFPFQTNHPFSSCRCYKDTCIITWNGRMIGCNFINSISEDALSGDLTASFRKLWDRLSTLQMPEKCKKCRYLKFCNPCPGTLEPESGDPEKVSDYVCKLARYRYYTENLKSNSRVDFQKDSCE